MQEGINLVNWIPLVIGATAILIAGYCIITPFPFNILTIPFGYLGFVALSAGFSPSVGE